MRPAAVRGSTEAVVRGSGTHIVDSTDGSSSSSSSSSSSRTSIRESGPSDAEDQATLSSIRSTKVSPSTVDMMGSPSQKVKRSGSADIEEVVEELVCTPLFGQ